MIPFSDEHIEFLKKKFVAHTESFSAGSKDIHDHIVLKRDHTFRVCKNIDYLAGQIGLSKQEKQLVYLIALFHDLGRFTQYHLYQTFDDSKSVDHAELSVKIIKCEGFFEDIPSKYHEIIYKSILNHNRPFPDFSADDEVALYSKLLRDADKLDIWYVITDDVLRKVIEKEKEDKEYQIPDAIFQQFLKKEFVKLAQVSNDNDMRLLRISWVFDINFGCTFHEIKNNKVLDKIFALMPQSEKLTEIKNMVSMYINEKALTW
ncbi:MAG: HD domain-containing protein [Bacteroidales bacterium]|nr:HD domain-containing protein [Bacteroidales bacterium]